MNTDLVVCREEQSVPSCQRFCFDICPDRLYAENYSKLETLNQKRQVVLKPTLRYMLGPITSSCAHEKK